MAGGERRESKAREVVEAISRVQLVPRDVPGAPDATHDFDVLRSGSVAGALEVTMLVEPGRAKLQGWVNKYGSYERKDLTSSWFVVLTDEAIGLPKSKEFLDDLARALRQLEAVEVERFYRRPWFHPNEALSPIERLPVSIAGSLPTDEGPAKVWLNSPSQGGAAWAGNAHNAIQEALNGDRLVGERAKLARSGAAKRHLFVWLDGLFEASLGLTFEAEPHDAAPLLPEEVTTIWIAVTSPEGAIVWRSSGGPWERHVAVLG